VYCWADGVHFRVRLEQARLCCLVLVGVRADGTKELVAVCDGERESTESWAELLRDLRRRGLGAPVVMVGDGALGLWAALRDVFPATRQQRDWVHKLANVLAALPKASSPAPARPWPRSATPRPRPCPPRHRGLRARLRRQVAQGRGQDHQRRRGVAVFLRLPSRALAAPEDQQPDRVDLRTGAGQDQGDQGARL
jgi:Transposase, Mutator family